MSVVKSPCVRLSAVHPVSRLVFAAVSSVSSRVLLLWFFLPVNDVSDARKPTLWDQGQPSRVPVIQQAYSVHDHQGHIQYVPPPLYDGHNWSPREAPLAPGPRPHPPHRPDCPPRRACSSSSQAFAAAVLRCASGACIFSRFAACRFMTAFTACRSSSDRIKEVAHMQPGKKWE